MCQRRQNSWGLVAKIGLIEIDDQIYAKQFGYASGDVGVTGEITIDLHCEQSRSGDDIDPTYTPAAAENLIDDWRTPSAMATFLKNPKTIRYRPCDISSKVSLRARDSWGRS